MKISFISTSHFPKDDRIYYHFAKSAESNGYKVEIITSNSNLQHRKGSVNINSFNGHRFSKKNKINKFVQLLHNFTPDTIICSEPLCILAAYRYKKKLKKDTTIIADITEWFPSKKNLIQRSIFNRSVTFIKLSLFNLYTAFLCDAFIFGEWYKSIPYKMIFPLKKNIMITYYPSKKYISILKPKLVLNQLNLGYSGKISKEKGFENFINVIHELLDLHPDLKLNLKIIGWPEDHDYKKIYMYLINDLKKRDVNIIEYNKLDLVEFVNQIKDTDIFIDLRANDFENQMCLPIRLFYYAALGRPVIFSDLKAIRKEVDIDKFGILVNPKNKKMIAKHIIRYLNDNTYYQKHCKNASDLYRENYNWERIENNFLEFIDKTSTKK